MDGSAEEHVVDARQQLNQAYDRFVCRFGPVNLRANQRAFDGDPDLPLLLSLENYNDETKRATKATIFHERTIHHRQAGRIRRHAEGGVARHLERARLR